MLETRILKLLMSALAGVCLLSWVACAEAPAPKPVKTDMLVGAYYFPGWCQESRWYCVAANDKVQHPLLGYYREGSPEAADWHIKWALDHGVSFFAFDFYTMGGSQMLESALDHGFMKSKYINQFKFCLTWCNHAPAPMMTAEELERFGDLVIKKYMTHPSYLKINGKPVIMILSAASFVQTLGIDGARSAFGRFRDRCKKAGAGDPYLVSCEGNILSEKDLKDGLASGADAYCLYNYPYAGTKFTGPGTHGEASYADMIEQGTGLWKHWRGLSDGAFWPTVMPGWDRRPWCKDADLIRTGSTPDLFEKALRSAREHVNKDKVVMIEAWNEWGEGSALEPSVERRFAYLDKVRTVFSSASGPHKDVDPKSLGIPAPVFNLRLPSTTSWRFDFDPLDWTSSGISDLRLDTGALRGAAATGDPQISSPITYIKCSDYPKLRIRMRVDHLDGGPDVTTAQLFWSTVESAMSEAASIQFPVSLDGKWHDYDLDMRANSRWNGRTDKLRLDPTDVAGSEFLIDEISFRK